MGLSKLVPEMAHRSPSTRGRGVAPPSTILDSRLVGTPAYMDPEYLATGRFGPMSDVFSLGVVMLQLLTGRPAAGLAEAAHTAWNDPHADSAALKSWIDARAGAWPAPEASPFAHLAARCAAPRREQRPDLREEVLPALLALAERAALYPKATSTTSALRSSSMNRHGVEPLSICICPITQVREGPGPVHFLLLACVLWLLQAAWICGPGGFKQVVVVVVVVVAGGGKAASP